MKPTDTIALAPGKRVLFMTKNPELIRKQLTGELDLQMKNLHVDDLLDDINTDAMTPAWTCFDWRPADIARNAYAGLMVDGERLFDEGALADAGFEVIVSGKRKGVGSSRETAVQAEKWSGIRIAIAASFAPIHARNNINQGVLMGDHAILARLQAGERIPLSEFTEGWDPLTRQIIEYGGLFNFTKAYARGEVSLPALGPGTRPQTMAEKILGSRAVDRGGTAYAGDPVCVRVDGGYSHEFTTAQVHAFLGDEFGEGYTLANPAKFAVFEDHLIYADGVPKMAPFSPKIQILRDLQRLFQKKTGVQDFSATNGVSPGICHTIAREKIIEPGDFIQATDSHTCMGGSLGALAYGVGATEYAALVHAGFTFVVVPASIRFELTGALRRGVTAKDVMLYILANHAKQQLTLDRVMEFGGPGLASLSPDERATLANMATECSAKAGIVEADEATLAWIAARRPGVRIDELRKKVVAPDPGAVYEGGVHTIDLSTIRPMVATPGDPAKGIPSDPTNGAYVSEIGDVRIDIAYGGSCTAGKEDDIDMYARVMQDAAASGQKVAEGVDFYIQFGSRAVEDYARKKGYLQVFQATGVKVISPGCGACIGCGPGVSGNPRQVSVSAINRNYQGRSGPGQLYLASPLNVAASAVAGKIVAYEEGMFSTTQKQ
ncbi:MAG: aconitate hydratase domain protein [Myxococcales bacterium]|nr:aconitate hydratase domain protein [Myxococcales bacterium]